VDYCAYESSEKARSEMWENAEKLYIRTLIEGEWKSQLKTYKHTYIYIRTVNGEKTTSYLKTQ